MEGFWPQQIGGWDGYRLREGGTDGALRGKIRTWVHAEFQMSIRKVRKQEGRETERMKWHWGSRSGRERRYTSKDSLGFFLQRAKSLQSCLTLCNPMDYSPPGSSVRGILQARMLEWVAAPSSRGSS